MKLQAQLCRYGAHGEVVRTAVPVWPMESIDAAATRLLCISATRTEKNESITGRFPLEGYWLEIRAYREDNLTAKPIEKD